MLPLSLVVVMTLAGCSVFDPAPDADRARSTPAPSPTLTPEPTPSEDAGGSVNNSAAYQEYLAAADEFEDQLPDGYVFPTDYPQGNADMAPKGTGTGAALFCWRCAWTDKFLEDFDARDQATIDRDLDTLDSWQDFSWVVENDVSAGFSWTDDVIEPAREGHISLLRTLGYAGCEEVKRDQPTSTESPRL